MAKATLGRTKLRVSRICFGSTSLASMPKTYGYEVSADRALETVRAIFDGPTNFLDTSRIYGFGRSEELIGQVIRERGGLPEGFVISTSSTETPRQIALTPHRPADRSSRACKHSGSTGYTFSICTIQSTPRRYPRLPAPGEPCRNCFASRKKALPKRSG